MKNMTPTMFEAIELIKKKEVSYSEYRSEKMIYMDYEMSDIYHGVLNFLSKNI